MLKPVNDWKDRMLAMPQVSSQSDGAWNLANFYGDMADEVQASSVGSVGIFIFNRALFVSELLAMGFGPDGTSAWADRLATAWSNAVAGTPIVASTVTDAGTWPVSVTDTLTPATGAAVILNLSACKDVLKNGLLNATTGFRAGTILSQADADPAQLAFAAAWRDATMAFIFTCKGIAGTPASPVPKENDYPAL